MTIKTLTYIHNLLKEEKEKQYEAYKHIRDIVTTARAENQPNADYLAELQDKAWDTYTQARHALEDFEEQDF